MQNCLNCGEELQGNYCLNCGQKHISVENRGLVHLLYELVASAFMIDNRFWRSIKFLILKPGVMTLEYIEGKRRNYVSPVTLFLIINVIYFFLSPLSDYSLPLYDQITLQPYSKHAKKLVDSKLEKDGLEFKDYALSYGRNSDNISKSIMILNVPIIALFIWPFSLRRTRYYFDSLIFALHFFTLFLLAICVGDILIRPIEYLWSGIGFVDNLLRIWIMVFVVLIPVSYCSIAFRNYLKFKWWISILGAILVFIGNAIAQFLYRAIIFYATFFLT